MTSLKALLCCLLLIGLTALPSPAQQMGTVPQVRGEHPRLLITPSHLQRLRELAQARTPHWRRLLSWALEPARKSALVQDGPGLALAALVLRQDDPALSQKLARQAVLCALRGARFGTVQSVRGRTLLSKSGNQDVLSLLSDGYRKLRPSAAQDRVFEVARYTATQVIVKSGGTLDQAAKPGDIYLLLQDDLSRATTLVQQVALTLDWAWQAFTPRQRQGISDWLTAQAQLFSGQGRGCFDSESAAALSLSALAGLAAFGGNPQAQGLVSEAWGQRYGAALRPCLLKLGQGGGWFEGDTPGARAGLDLVLFAAAFKTAAGADATAGVAWFQDRLSYLLFHLLPGLAKAKGVNYRRVAPGGDALLPPDKAADLVRMQMLGMISLRPDDPAAGASRALLLDPRVPGLLYGPNFLFDFLWVDPTAPTAPLATATLSHLAPAVGQAVLRSDWSERATWLGFSSGPHFALRQHLSAASLLIFRRAFLLPQGGGYDGPTSSHALNYAIRSVAHNTLLVYDPQEYSWYNLRAGDQPKGTYSNDGGQRAWALFDQKGQISKSAPWTASGLDRGKAPWSQLGPIYKVAQIEALEDQPRYAYLRGRATAAYDGSTHKVKRLVRHVFLLRANGPDDAEAAEAVVVADDLVLARQGLAVRFALHFKQRPSTVGPLSKLAAGRWRGPASALVAAAGTDRLDVVPILPDDSRLDIIGGAGVAGSWVDNRDYPPRPPAVNPAPWRAEYVVAEAKTTQRPLLHVLLPADLDAPPPPALRRLQSQGKDTIGVVIKDPTWPRVLALHLGPPSREKPVVYRYPPGRTRHLVAGLLPETEYRVQVDPTTITISPGQGLKSSPAGLLAFRVAPPEKKPEQAPRPPSLESQAEQVRSRGKAKQP